MKKLLIIFAILLFSISAQAANYNISYDGDGSTTIDGDTACGGSACTDGDTLTLPAGACTDALTFQNFAGSADYIIVQNEDSVGNSPVTITTSTLYPVWIKDSTYLWFNGSGDADITTDGVADNKSKGIVVNVTGASAGIVVSGDCSNIKISYVEMTSTNTTYSGGIKVGQNADGNTKTVDGLIVEYNYVHDIGYSGFYIGSDDSTYADDLPYIKDVVVRYNLLEDLGHYGMTVKRTRTDSSPTLVYGNIVRPSNRASGNSTGIHPQTPPIAEQFYHGIGVKSHWGTTYARVYDNWIEKTQGPGLKISRGDTHLIYDNTIVGCGTGDDTTAGHGIVTNTSGSNIEIYDNYILEPTRYGVYAWSTSTAVVLSRNKIGEAGVGEWTEEEVGDVTESSGADANDYQADIDSYGFDVWSDDGNYSNDSFTFAGGSTPSGAVVQASTYGAGVQSSVYGAGVQ